MQSPIIKVETEEYVTNNYDNIKEEHCDSDSEYAGYSVYHCAEKLKGEEVNLRYNDDSADVHLDSFEEKKCQITDKNVDCGQFEEHAHPDVGISGSQPINAKSSEQTKTIKLMTEERLANYIFGDNAGDSMTGILDLKTEELDLECDCTEHSVNLSMQSYEHMYNVCEKNLCKISDLKKQLITHADEKPHKCNVCEKKFFQLSHLKQHMVIHTGEKPHACPVCEKKFTQKSGLNKHMMTHTGEKTHKCSVCEMKFTHKCHLNHHMVTHTGEKRYKCTVCDRKFPRLNSLNLHMITHTGDKLHRCTVCEKKFARKYDLNIHTLKHTGDKPHTCKICEKKFAQKTLLNKHMFKHL